MSVIIKMNNEGKFEFNYKSKGNKDYIIKYTNYVSTDAEFQKQINENRYLSSDFEKELDLTNRKMIEVPRTRIIEIEGSEEYLFECLDNLD